MDPSNDPTKIPNQGGDWNHFVLSIGDKFGQYRVLRYLGIGGMGQVYAMEHEVLGTIHAFKLIHPQIATRADINQRFKNEAKVMAKLRHPGIVCVDDYGETAGKTWLRMELVGRTDPSDNSDPSDLSDYLQARAGKLPEREAAEIIRQILEALAYAHAQGVVHRDLKPANILLSNRSDKSDPSDTLTIKIADFGLVSLAGEQWLRTKVEQTVARSIALGSEVTQVNTGNGFGDADRSLLGTYTFMSPEQRKGAVVDHRSDLYSVGLLAFQLLTGEERPTFIKPTQLNPLLDPGWDDWIIKAMMPNVDMRFQSAQAMLEQIPLRQLKSNEQFNGMKSRKKHTVETVPELNNSGNSIGESVMPDSRLKVRKIWAMGVIAFVSASSIFVYWGIQRPELSPFLPDWKDLFLGLGNRLLANSRVHGVADESAVDQVVKLGEGVLLDLVWISGLNAWVGKYEVTNAQFRRFRPSHNSGAYGSFSLNADEQPVVNITFLDVLDYMGWLNTLLPEYDFIPPNFRFRLPSGVEWTYLASQGSTRSFPWGDAWPPAYGNFSCNESQWAFGFIEDYTDGFAVTAPVQKSGVNELGLYGLAGNVWEWTTDVSGNFFAFRGGAWNSADPSSLRISARHTLTSGIERTNFLGFRVILTAQ